MMPVKGCIVQQKNIELSSKNARSRLGTVVDTGHSESDQIKVRWFDTKEEQWCKLSSLSCGLKPEMEVIHQPVNAIQESLGWGKIRHIRETADMQMVLVEFPVSNKRLWLPWQRLAFTRSISDLFNLAYFENKPHSAERQRLRMLAWAIQLWNENTGSLSTFDIDPLPHQIHLVHHILASGQYNWLIADDVGLGKTIEVGLLLSALRHRDQARRVLLITPAGLTKQWQEEMAGRFGIDQFQIYGDDFHINDVRNWSMYPYVIGSIDRFKNDEHQDKLLQAEPWDLVIVDEAHRLTRRQYGNKLDASQRYALLHKLRKRSEHILLLSATPHQGKEDSFIGLLELLHPDRKNDLLELNANPGIVGEMVFRNNKADVTYLDGSFIFKGKTVRQIEAPTTELVLNFDRNLQEYFKEGYNAEARLSGNGARAIGFVMMVYRKLAASSIAAIHHALVRRLERLEGAESKVVQFEDERFEGEQQELQLESEMSATPFFENEKEMLMELITQAELLKQNDCKIQAFMDGLVSQILVSNPKEKILIFTEYRNTLQWIVQALADRFGAETVGTIHGGMPMKERRAVISQFDEEDGIQFIVSTEAGGEGINLQKNCHIMVNYDLPWNPMRLVQRIGRLYRYNQKKRVVVFNLRQEDSADDRILGILYERLEQVAKDMAPVEQLQEEAMKEDILGGISSLLDVEAILKEAANSTISRTKERIEEALKIAKDTAQKQNDIFKHAAGFNPNEIGSELSISHTHLQSFVDGMARQLNIEIVEKTHKELVWQIRLSESLMEKLGISRSRLGICFDRYIAAKRPDLLPINLDNWFFKFLVKEATDYQFGGITALTDNLKSKALVAAVARWQNDQGKRVRQEFTVMSVDGGQASINPDWLNQWLLQEQTGVVGKAPARDVSGDVLNEANKALSQFISGRSKKLLFPEEAQWVTGNWQI